MNRHTIANFAQPFEPTAIAGHDALQGTWPETSAAQTDLVVADASWSWTQQLFSPLAELGVRVLLLKVADWRTAALQKRPAGHWLWPRRQLGPNLWEQSVVLPPGWMKTYPKLGMRPISWVARRWRASIGPRSRLALAITYPYYLELARQLRPERLIYYNMDDYTFYWKHHAKSVRELERLAVRRADVSAFCAQLRAAEAAHFQPSEARRIVHLPHGTRPEAIATHPLHQPLPAPAELAALPRPYLGFVGSLEDRLDWVLLHRLARAFPTGTVVLIGRRPTPPRSAAWAVDCQAVLAQPNVRLLGWRNPPEVAELLSSLDVCLIPYRTDDAFNRACSPTKLVDYMASTRPVVATDLPECRLYTHLFHVANSHEQFVAQVKEIVRSGSDDGRSTLRWHSAHQATWPLRARTLWSELARAAWLLHSR
jgi:glycosyltransferase involved in cell wall biosynthesis